MDQLYQSWPKFLWPNILNHLTSMEDVCSLAMVNMYCYKVVNEDFKNLCYKNAIFRTKGETWAYAFQHSNNRTFGQVTQSVNNKHASLFLANSICCPHSGMIANLVSKSFVFITNIDASLKKFEVINCSPHIITDSQLIKKGTQLILQTADYYYVYDIVRGKSIKVYHYVPKSEYGWYLLRRRDGTLIDIYNQRKLKLEATMPNKQFKAHLHPNDMFNERNYIQYFHKTKGHMILNLKTGKEVELPVLKHSYRGDMVEINGFYIYATHKKVYIYNLDTGECVFTKHISGACLFSNEMIYSRCSREYVVYDTRREQWIYTTKCHHRIMALTIDTLVPPFHTATLGYTFEPTKSPGFAVHIEFKNDRLITRTFKPVQQHNAMFAILKVTTDSTADVNLIASNYLKVLNRVKLREKSDTVPMLTKAETILRNKHYGILPLNT
ncbi:unnamed protein product [Bursaphelenchus okinawaensis]|uniref:F-box domain-containing protein n=1 Tax=Bursaphelenchus okinawaensis TaxID=465554 RepID=A0A811KAI1_9BILA|nr:unnamed protein product [Bursaphelenchus okinawaensis]CAG9095819.1 unnamed protein product [Bursaphelenchus okinawaensis]